MAGIPAELPVELHDKWTLWHDHYRKDGSSPRRAAEEALASVRAHYLQEGESGAVVVRQERRALGGLLERVWQPLCGHCGASEHEGQTCAQASAGALFGIAGRAA